jgi:hypothetical protein
MLDTQKESYASSSSFDQHLAPECALYEASYATGQQLAGLHLGAQLWTTISARLKMQVILF